MRTVLTKEKRETFLILLAVSGVVSYACSGIGIARQTAYDHKGKDEEFSDRWDAAVEDATNALEMEARRRAIDGIGKGVYYQGIRVDTEKVYSDNLLMFLLKGRRPAEFGPGDDGGGGPENEVEGFDYEDV